MKTALLRAVSHDLRSPLTAIAAAGEAIASPTLGAEERAELAAVIQEEARRLARLVDNLLDLSRLEAGAADAAARLDLRRRPAAHRAARSSARATGEFSLSIDRDAAARQRRPRAARARVRERARERAPPQRRPLRCSVPARDAVRERRASCAIVDRGPGSRRRSSSGCSSPSTARAARPAGIAAPASGLAIARGFIEANGGRLHVESLPGQGATSSSSCRSKRAPAPARTVPWRPRGTVVSPRERKRRPAGARGRRRAADPARAEGHLARGGLRGRARRDGRRGARPRRGAPAGGRDHRPRAARQRRRRRDAPAARVEPDADPRPLGDGRRGRQGARAGGRRRRLRHQAFRLARAGRAPAGGAAPRGGESGRAGRDRRRPRGRPRRALRSGATARPSTSPRSSSTCCARWCATAGG